MFKFDLSTLNDIDVAATIKALHFILTADSEQQDNLGFQYLFNIMIKEAELRDRGDIGGEIDVSLPYGAMTPSHVWFLTRFACGVVQAGAQEQPAAMLCFFAGIVDEIEEGARRIISSVRN